MDFLDTKGIQVEAKPNTKLDPEVYALVRSNFQGDKDAKEAAQRSTVNVDRENVSLASAKKKEVEEPESSAEKIDLNIFKKEEVEEEVKEEVKEEKKEEKPAPQAPKPKASPLKVVGKVDFEAQEKEAAEKRAAAEESRIKAKLEAEKIVVKSAIKPIEKKEEAPVEDAPDVVKAKVEQLSGPKVVGKIELPVEKPKSSDDGKRKRVRVKKVDVKKQANQARQNNKNKKKVV